MTLRRILTGLLALLFGFGASLLAFRASDWATSGTSNGTRLGVLDFTQYCRLAHGPEAQAVHDRLDAYGWECSFWVKRRYNLRDVDGDQACTKEYRTQSYGDPADPSSPYSWECFRGHRPNR